MSLRKLDALPPLSRLIVMKCGVSFVADQNRAAFRNPHSGSIATTLSDDVLMARCRAVDLFSAEGRDFIGICLKQALTQFGENMHTIRFASLALSMLLVTPSWAAAPTYKIVDRIEVGDGRFDYGVFDDATNRIYMSRSFTT